MTRAALGYQGIYSFSIEVRPSHYIMLFMPMKCSAPYLTLPLESVVNFHQLAVWQCLVGVCHGYFSAVLGFTNRSHTFPPLSPLLMDFTLVLSVQLAIFLKGD